jgi:hypothetical protein
LFRDQKCGFIREGQGGGAHTVSSYLGREFWTVIVIWMVGEHLINEITTPIAVYAKSVTIALCYRSCLLAVIAASLYGNIFDKQIYQSIIVEPSVLLNM